MAIPEKAAEWSNGGGLVFPGPPLSENTHTKPPRELGFGAATNGFRSIFKDWARLHDVDETPSLLFVAVAWRGCRLH